MSEGTTFPEAPVVKIPQDVSILLRPRRVGFREVMLVINHVGPSFRASSAATEMLIWGDLDPNCNPRIQATPGESAWMPLDLTVELVLSAGTGPKYVNARLRGAGGETEAMQAIGEVGTQPHASLLWSAFRLNGPTLMGFSPSHAATAYRFAMCSTEGDFYDDNVPFLTGGALTPGQYVEVVVPAHDGGHIIVKMFIEVASYWYA